MFKEAIENIYKFNKENGLLEDGYKDTRECAFPIEEALEELGVDYIDTGFCGNPKELSRAVMAHVDDRINIDDVHRLDKHLDIIIYSIGSIFKLGLNQEAVAKALLIVSEKNLEKSSVGKDEYGKQMKPKDFVGPESMLLELLNQRNNDV
jgi:hypothetical protein